MNNETPGLSYSPRQVLPPPQESPITPHQVSMSSHFPPDVEERTHGSIRIMPSEKVYENIESDEQVILSVGRHWSQIMSSFMTALLFAVIPFIALPIIIWSTDASFITRYSIIATYFWYCFIFYYLVTRLIVWKSDVYIITNERIIDFDASNFDKKVSDTDLLAIHEVQYEAGGGLILGRLDRGDLIIVDVSGKTTRMPNMPMPSSLALAIGELIEAAQKRGINQPAPATVNSLNIVDN